ncbi:unnamed protein product [Oreochromis niloticus]|nr:unnamed protein product [Mustela putorius furo]
MKIITGDGVSATITVRMKQSPEGHLTVEIQYCKVKTDTIRTKSNNFSGKMLGILIKVLKNFFMKKICPALQPMINNKLKDLSTMRIHEGRQLDLDFSLSKDIAVTSSSFDISFKGLMSVNGQAVDTDSIRPGKEPVFTETSQMIYVGFSEFFFNVAAMAIYKSGPFVLDTDILHRQLAEWMPKRLWDSLFNVVGIASGPFKVALTKAPDVHISKDGLSATVDIEVKSDGQQSLRMTCRDNMNVEFKERHLIPVFQNPKCEDTIGTIKKKIQTGVVLNTYIYIINKLFVKEIPIPLPAELSIIDAKTQFEEGYLVVGGSLTFNPQSSSNAGG